MHQIRLIPKLKNTFFVFATTKFRVQGFQNKNPIHYDVSEIVRVSVYSTDFIIT